MLHRARTMPRPLIIRVVDFACGIKTNPSRGPDATASRDELSVGLHTHRPTAKLCPTSKRSRQTKHHPKIAVFVKTRSKCVLVVISTHAPFVRNRGKSIRPTISILVLQAGHLITVGLVK